MIKVKRMIETIILFHLSNCIESFSTKFEKKVLFLREIVHKILISNLIHMKLSIQKRSRLGITMEKPKKFKNLVFNFFLDSNLIFFLKFHTLRLLRRTTFSHKSSLLISNDKFDQLFKLFKWLLR